MVSVATGAGAEPPAPPAPADPADPAAPAAAPPGAQSWPLPPLPGQRTLHEHFAAAPDLQACCDRAVDLLLGMGMHLPSLYLARGERLRCLAVRGYWQAFDGIPPGAGVIGTVWATDEPRELRGVANDHHHLPSAVSVRDEVCVPLHHDGRCVGALNVESTARLRPDALAVVSAVAAAFEDRLAQLGGPAKESLAQRMGRHAAGLVTSTGPGDVVRRTLDAAVELSGMPSALLGLREQDEGDEGPGPVPAGAAGPLADRLCGAAGLLATTESWVLAGTSVFTVDEPTGHLFEGSHRLREAGAAAAVVLPLGTPQVRQGVLVVADEVMSRPSTETVAVLELLAALAGAHLQSARLLVRLRDRAARDPLTGLGHHGTFAETLELALGTGSPPEQVAVVTVVAVIMADLDGFKRVNDAHGHQAGDRLLQRAADEMSAVLREGDLHRVGGDEFAAVVRVSGPQAARAVGERLRAAVAGGERDVTLSVGVAVAGAGEPAEQLRARADAALYLAKQRGRDRVELAVSLLPGGD